MDFIPKPYPQPEVILARILRTIELSEDRDIIQSTERDSLTGLYNREYFYRYAEQYDQFHRDTEMDAFVVDVNHFHMINERYGKAYGDDVLRRIGEKVREMVRDSGGIVCRRESDTFMVYCPHRDDYRDILQNASVGLAGSEGAESRVRLRIGVYSCVDKSIEIERRFDRAKMAADTVRGTFARAIAFYDNTLHESELYAEQLLEDFYDAIAQKQFAVYYQPKFDVRPEIPVLESAEALVRWKHPTLGMISPGVFIPLFEDNGLIRELDNYVWETAAAQVRDWKERFGFTVPVSVNVSRIDMYDPNLVNVFEDILSKNGLTPDEFLLEITESAYTQDSEQIIEVVNELRSLGFRIEMDDFGTGYSSLNMLSRLPIDALKLDMQFIRNAFREKGDTRMLEVIIDLADYLSVPTIAEGVETEEQFRALKAMGCDIVQGYYFSKPVPAEDYEKFIEERKEIISADSEFSRDAMEKAIDEAERDISLGRIAHALSSGFESIYYVDTENNHYVEFSSQGKYEDLQIQRSGADFFADTQTNIRRVVYPDDQERVALSMQKETLLAQLVGGRHYSMTYRLVIAGKPIFYNLKAVRANTHGSHHVVIGVSDVDIQMQEAIGTGETYDGRTDEFSAIAQALSSEFESIYYVDTLTNDYSVLTAQGNFENLRIEYSGTDFFNETRINLKKLVHPEDQDKIGEALSKEHIMNMLKKEQSFSVSYRLMIDGVPTWYLMKAFPSESEEGHIVIGVSNVQAAVEKDYRKSGEDSVTYARIAQALSHDYFTIYYVNVDSDRFFEYSTDGPEHSLKLERVGERFFEDCKRAIPEQVYPDDQEKALAAFEKDSLLQELENGRTFSIVYRLLVKKELIYVNLKVIRMADDPSHIVIGISDVNARMKREAEYEAAKKENVTFAGIAQALAVDYFSIYYVDTATDRFIEYSSHDGYEELNIEKGGEDFFSTCMKNIDRVIYPDDRETIKAAMQKETFLKELAKDGTVTLNYRLLIDNKPTYVSLKATHMDDDNGEHIVIGVSNVDAQMQRQKAYEEARAQSMTYSRIAQALSRDYYSIYFVDTDTDEFIEYSSQSEYQELQVEQNGIDFFEDTRRNILRLVYPEDVSKALAFWEKDRLLPALADGKISSTIYRLMFDGVPVYINCKVIRMTDGDDHHIVVGVSNIDTQIKRELELSEAKEKAYRDALTGVKTKYAYTEAEADQNQSIEAGISSPFAVAVCDLNDLKKINDTLGHQAGDQYIKEASRIICNIFKHSPVYRIGGDEFVAVLRNSDYEHRDQLMTEVAWNNAQNKETNGIVIAGGVAEYRPGEDKCFGDVFRRADAAMYENKSILKGERKG